MFLVKTIKLALKIHRPLVQYADRTQRIKILKVPPQCKTRRGFFAGVRDYAANVGYVKAASVSSIHRPLSPHLAK
jgi:hypothetical protein